MSGSIKSKSKHKIAKDISEIADSIGRMREQPDGEGNSRSVATQSVFKEAKELLRIKKAEGMDEKFTKAVLEQLYDMLEGLIPIAEHQYRKYPGDRFAAMSLNTYVIQMRDIMKDIRNIQSFEGQVSRITTYNFTIFQQILQSYADSLYLIRSSVKANADPAAFEAIDKVMMKAIDSHGSYIQESLKAINAKVEEQLI